MAYGLHRKESVEAGIKRVVREQIDRALEEIADDALDRHEAVHQVRKRCKKIRAVVRLVRPVLGATYRIENVAFRDTAAALSSLRDAQVLRETYDELAQSLDAGVDRRSLGKIRRALTMRLKKVEAGEEPLDERLRATAAELRDGRSRVETWTFEADGFDAIEKGLKKTYRRGRNAMADAYDDPSSASFHEWRKRVKYHWYHMRLLRNMRRKGLKGRCREARELGTLLGDHHNLCVLEDTILSEPKSFGDKRTVDAFLVHLATHRRELEKAAKPLGKKLFAEKPKHFIKRFRAYWDAWK